MRNEKVSIASIISMAKIALTQIDREINEHNQEKYLGIENVKKKLLQILEELEENNIPDKSIRISGLGRMVIDTWPLNSELAELVVKTEQAYLSLK